MKMMRYALVVVASTHDGVTDLAWQFHVSQWASGVFLSEIKEPICAEFPKSIIAQKSSLNGSVNSTMNTLS